MATKKFSEFPLVPSPVLADIVIVGLDASGQNAQFPGDLFGGGSGTTDHAVLSNRGIADQHPQSAITGLVTAQAAQDAAIAASAAILANVTVPVSPFAATLLDDADAAAVIATLGLDADLATFSLPASTTIAAFGKTLVASVVEGDARSAMHITDGFSYLAQGEPLLIGCIGDSNASGGTDINTSLVAPNANIDYYALETAGEAYDIANLGWFSLDPNSTIRSTQQSSAAGGGVTMTGQLLGGSNPIDMMAAYTFNALTGRKVGVYKNALGNQSSGSWLSGGHAGFPYDLDGYTPTFGANNASAAAAIAAFNTKHGTSKTFFDVIIISLGANDMVHFNLTGAQFYANMQTIWNSMVTAGWLNPAYTQVFHVENVNNNQSNIVAQYKTGWTGYSLMQANNSERYTLVSSLGAVTIDATNLHYPGTQYQTFGRTIAAMALAGTSPKIPLRQNTYMEKLNPVLGADLNMNGFGLGAFNSITSNVTPTGVADVAFTFNFAAGFTPVTDELMRFVEGSTETFSIRSGGAANFGPLGSELFQIGAFGVLNKSLLPLTVSTGDITASVGNLILTAGGATVGTGVLTSSVAATGGTDTAWAVNAGTGFNAFDKLVSFNANSAEPIILYMGGAAQFGPSGSYFSIGALGVLNESKVKLSLTTGELESQVGNGASAVAFKSTTVALSTPGAKIQSWVNGVTEKVYFSLFGDGVFQGGLSGTTGVFSSTLAVTGTSTLTGQVTATAGISLPSASARVVGYDTGISGNIIFQPLPANTTEKFEFSSLSNEGFLSWTPQTAASGGAIWFINYKTHVSNTAFKFKAQTAMTSGNLWELVNAGTATKTSINYVGLPFFGGSTAPPTALVASGGGGNNTPSTAGSGVITILSTSLWNGGSGTGYSISDIVKTLKNIGLLAA